jgi:hypothetical protein
VDAVDGYRSPIGGLQLSNTGQAELVPAKLKQIGSGIRKALN